MGLKTSLISDEDLLLLAAGGVSSASLDPIAEFIDTFKVIKGKNPVPKFVVYNAYKRSVRAPLTKGQFIAALALKIPSDASSFYVGDEFFTTATFIAKTFTPPMKKKKDPTTNPRHQKQFRRYAEFYNINKGDYWIEDFVLFHFYDKWNYNEKPSFKAQFSLSSFRKQAEIQFEHKRDGKGITWFKIDAEHLTNISPEQIGNIRAGRKKRRSYGKKGKQTQQD